MGIDPFAFLTATTDFDRGLVAEIAKRAHKERELIDKRLANFIAGEVSKLFKS